MKYKTTADIPVPHKMVDQVIGQEKGVEIIKKAAAQKRNVLLIGNPGTGKSMLAQAMAELLPAEQLEDIIIYPNFDDENNPKVKMVPAGQGRKIINEGKKPVQQDEMKPNTGPLLLFSLIFAIGIALAIQYKIFSDIILAALIVVGGIFLAILVFASAFATSLKTMRFGGVREVPAKILVDNSDKKIAPYVDATGARAGSLLGDVRHDPYQCIPASEFVYLDNGKPVKIEELVDPLFNGKNKIELEISSIPIYGGFDEKFDIDTTKAFSVYRRHYSGDIIEIETKLGNKIRVTPNHPLAMLDKSLGIEYSEAENIKEGQYLITPNSLHLGDSSTTEPIELYADILADAYVGERRVDFKFARDFKIKTVTDDIKKAGYDPTTRMKTYTLIGLNSASFVRHLHEIGLMEEKTKRIPSFIFELNRDLIAGFVSRLLSLDGYVGKNGQFEILQANKDLLIDLKVLLLKLGIKASWRTRIDRGFKKGNIQNKLVWANFEWARLYYELTVNPIHRKNLEIYFKDVNSGHVAFHDEMPIDFEYLEQIRSSIGVSKEKMHPEYYALNQSLASSKTPTRQSLLTITNSIKQYSSELSEKLNLLINGNYAFDKIVSIKKVPYEGYVYNLTTLTGNYLVNGILTHNSGGLGTPAHMRVEAGAIHRANKGVLFIDEVATLSPKSQQELLTAMQEKKYSITGQSELSSGAMVRTDPVPCDFLLILSGNYFDLAQMHPALRSRIRGYGYEVYLNDTIEDTPANREKIVRFIAQEVVKDGKIPHFDREAVEEIMFEARRRAGRKNKLTLQLRDLGGLVRAAGDVAKTKHAKLVTRDHVIEAKKLARTLEQQIADKAIDVKKEYGVLSTKGFTIGKINGLAVMGSSMVGSMGGLVMPIEAEVAPALSPKDAKLIATGKLGEIAKEAVQNVSAIIKKYKGTDIANFDIHIQFLQSYEGVEGDSASVSVATAVISALERIPIDQSIAMTGSLSVKGEVLPVGGITEKVEAAIDAGLKTVIIPESNKDDIVLNKKKLGKIKIITARDLSDVLQHSLKQGKERDELIKKISKITKA